MEISVFIPIVIVALTQLVKMALPKSIHGFVTVVLAIVMGITVSLVAEPIGLAQVTIAEGIVAALSAIGISTVASKAAGGAKGDG